MQKTSFKDSMSPIDTFFEQYKDRGEDEIGPEGVERLCKDLDVDPSNRRVLILAWTMGARRMGYFSRAEFRRGCKLLGVTTLSHLKKSLPKLDLLVQPPQQFSSFYNFAFQYCLTEPGQKIIDVNTAIEMLKLVYPGGPFVSEFSSYLEEQQDYKKINLDQWSNFLRFSQEVKADMSNAGDNPAWPLLLDNFVEWYGRSDPGSHCR